MTKTYKHPKVKVNLKVIQLLNKITILQNIFLTARGQTLIEIWYLAPRTLTLCCHILYVYPVFVRHVAENREDGKP